MAGDGVWGGGWGEAGSHAWSGEGGAEGLDTVAGQQGSSPDEHCDLRPLLIIGPLTFACFLFLWPKLSF